MNLSIVANLGLDAAERETEERERGKIQSKKALSPFDIGLFFLLDVVYLSIKSAERQHHHHHCLKEREEGQERY